MTLVARRGAIDSRHTADQLGAVAYWRAASYSGSGDLLDESGNGHHLTNHGAAFAAGVFTFVAGELDYMETADHADFNFAATDSFTVCAAVRFASLPVPANYAVMAKRAAVSSGAGWNLYLSSGTSAHRCRFGDGTADVNANSPTIVAATPTLLSGVRNVTLHNDTAYAGTTAGANTSDTTTATLSNTSTLRIGRLSGAGTAYASMDFFGAAVFRRVLTAAELSQVATALGV